MLDKLGSGIRAQQDLGTVGTALGRGPNLRKKLNKNQPLWVPTFPSPQATIDVDFVNNLGFAKSLGQSQAMSPLAFTRASSATFVDNDGLLATAASNQSRLDWTSNSQGPRNILLYTQDFTNAIWVKTGSSINATPVEAPDGTLTAWYLQESALNEVHRIQQNITRVGTNTLVEASVFVKKAERRYATVGLLGPAGAFSWASITLDFDTGLISGQRQIASGTVVSSSVTDVGNGWFRLVMRAVNPTFPLATTFLVEPDILPNRQSGTYTGDGTSGIYIWGAQLQISVFSNGYLFNTAYSPINIPLKATTTCNGILIEEQRTNSALWCRDATQAAWVKTDVTAAKDQIGIDGVENESSSLTATADNGTCIQTVTLASSFRIVSVYLKRITGTGDVQFSVNNGTDWSTIDLSDTEWRRVIISATLTNPTVGIRLSTNGDSIAMDFAQVENTPHSTQISTPILTTTSTATRSADVPLISATAFNNAINQNEGTHYLECQMYTGHNSVTKRLIAYNSFVTPLTRVSDSQIQAYNGTNVAGNYGGLNLTNNTKMIMAYDRSTTTLSGNGLTPTSYNVVFGGFSQVRFFSRDTGADQMSGYIKRYTYYPVRYNNATLRIISGATP